MSILVTGCMGFIGSNLVPKILATGQDVIGIDNLCNPSINPTDRMKKASGLHWRGFKFYKLDIKNPDHMASIASNEDVDCIVHLAAIGSVPRSFKDPLATVSTNEGGFASIMSLASAMKIRRVVFASSSSVYGTAKEPTKKEGHEGYPISPYALSKAMNERFAMIYAPPYKINFAGLRFFNVYGPGQSFNSDYSAVIPKFINTPRPEVYGDGSATRDFTFVGDTCEAIVKAVDYTKGGSLICNVGTGVGNDVNTILSLLGKQADKTNMRYGDVQISIADTERAKKVLGFEAKIMLPEGLEITKAYYESLKVKPNEKIDKKTDAKSEEKASTKEV